MFSRFSRQPVPTVPRKEYEALQAENRRNLEEKANAYAANADLAEANQELEAQTKQLGSDVDTLREANQKQLEHCMELTATLQQAINLLLKVDSKRTGGKEWSDQRAGIVIQAKALGIDVFEVVATPKEAKEVTDGNN